MLTFKILRYQSLPGRRVSRYLAYALGEVILIVIGILLALQVNEWNARRAQNSESSHYLARLDAELASHESELLDQIQLTAVRMESVNVVLRAIERSADEVDFNRVYEALGHTNNIKQLSLDTSVYAESVNLGKDHLLPDPGLKKALAAYYAQIEGERNLNDIGLRYHWRQFYSPFINQYLNAARMHKAWARQTFGRDLGMYELDLPVAPLWSLPEDHPVKRQFANELSSYNSGMFYAQWVQEKLLEASGDIREQIEAFRRGAQR